MIPLVLLPGMMCDARLFSPQINAFSQSRIIHFAPILEVTTQATAAVILKTCPPRFALAGLSMGGIVAMEILRQAPDRVDRIALLDTNPLSEPLDFQARRNAQIEKVQAGGLTGVMRNEMKPHYLTNGRHRDTILELCMDMAETMGPQIFVAQSKALQSRLDQTETLRACRVPSLVLCGRDDALCPVHRHELMHDLMQGSVLKVIENAGHLPTLEQPEQTTAALARWLEVP
jgi:pimeloyl-ACP methyl ester carboxylesterase